MIKANGKVTRKEVMASFKISNSTADRLLAGMEAKGLIKQEGHYKGTVYVIK